MLMRIAYFVFLVLTFFQTSAQSSLLLKVLDPKGNSIPNCSVTWNQFSGLVTNTQGQVLIEDTRQIKDSIVINTIGYQPRVLFATEIADKTSIEITLEENYIVMPEIKIGNKQKIYVLGCTEKKEGYSYITNLNNSTLQTAFLIKDYPSGSILKECLVFISKKSDEKIPFRVRVYSNNNGAPGKDLTSENIIISNYRSDKWNTIPLDSLYLNVPDNGFFIGIEWLITSDLKNYHLSIGQTDALKTENSFVRWGNTDWRKFSRPSPINKNPTNVMIQARLSNL
jgi:hypothetical protein